MSTDSTPNNRSGYMNSYYRKNKERILAQRKRRYQSDAEYRDRLNNQRRMSRRLNQEPQVYQSADVDESTDHKEIDMSLITKMRVLHPNDRSLSCVCDMHTIKSLAYSLNVEKRKIDAWLAQDKLPQPRYRNDRNWRLYTEYEVKAMESAFKKARKVAKLNNYAFRLTQEVRKNIEMKFSNFVGGIPEDQYEETP